MKDQQLPIPSWEEWTPARAQSILDQQKRLGFENPRGSRTRKHRVGLYASEMRRGHWHSGGATIQFNGSKLLDGWHRLEAIVLSETTQVILTVRGVSTDTVPTIDTGLGRRAGDVLASWGVASSNRVAAAARICVMYEATCDVRNDPDRNPTHREIVEYAQSNQALTESAVWAGVLHVRLLGSPATLAAWHFMCGRTRPVERDAFFSDLLSGAGLKSESPVFVLRETLLKNRSGYRRFPAYMISAFVVKAWNAYLEGRGMKLLRYTLDESFPILRK